MLFDLDQRNHKIKQPIYLINVENLVLNKIQPSIECRGIMVCRNRLSLNIAEQIHDNLVLRTHYILKKIIVLLI